MKQKTAFLAVKFEKQAQQIYRHIFQENYGLIFKAAMAVNWFFMLNHTRRSCDSLNDKITKKLTEFANRIRHLSALIYPTINAEFCDDLCGDQFVDALHTSNFV